MSDDFVYKCPCCDRVMTGLPAIAFDLPALAAGIPKDEGHRMVMHNETCVVDDEHHFVRAVLVMPIIGETETLEFGVWGSLSHENFDRYVETIKDDDQSKLGPMFSWFSNVLPLYETSTLSLKANLIPQDGGQRPLVRFHSEEMHPAAADSREGITRERAIAFAALVLPRH